MAHGRARKTGARWAVEQDDGAVEMRKKQTRPPVKERQRPSAGGSSSKTSPASRWGHRGRDPDTALRIAALAGWHSPAIGQPVEVTVYPAANLAEIQIPLAGTGTDAVSQHALTTLHNTIVPATVGKIPGGQALVGGNLAENNDFNNQLQHGIVPVILFVLGITFILMTIGFDSIVIATTTIGLNLLKGSDLTFDHPYNGGYLCTSRRASAPSVTSRHHRRQLGPRVCVGLGLAGITPVRRGCCARGGAAV